MTSHSSGRNGRRSRGGSRRRGDTRPRHQSTPSRAPAKKSFWQKITALFTGGKPAPTTRPVSQSQAQAPRSNGFEPSRSARKPESVEVTTPRLYVGNLSFDASESDLFELFNGVGAVQNAEVVTYKHNQRSKGFAFVQMLTVDEAKRAVEELHDKEFLGRKLVVSGAKSSEHHSAA
jgi:hypothetical protein